MSKQLPSKASHVLLALIVILMMPLDALAARRVQVDLAGSAHSDGFDHATASIRYQFIVCAGDVTLLWEFERGSITTGDKYRLDGRPRPIPESLQNPDLSTIPVTAEIRRGHSWVGGVEDPILGQSLSYDCFGGQTKVIAPVTKFLGDDYSREEVSALLASLDLIPLYPRRLRSAEVERWLRAEDQKAKMEEERQRKALEEERRARELAREREVERQRQLERQNRQQAQSDTGGRSSPSESSQEEQGDSGSGSDDAYSSSSGPSYSGSQSQSEADDAWDSRDAAARAAAYHRAWKAAEEERRTRETIEAVGELGRALIQSFERSQQEKKEREARQRALEEARKEKARREYCDNTPHYHGKIEVNGVYSPVDFVSPSYCDIVSKPLALFTLAVEKGREDIRFLAYSDQKLKVIVAEGGEGEAWRPDTKVSALATHSSTDALEEIDVDDDADWDKRLDALAGSPATAPAVDFRINLEPGIYRVAVIGERTSSIHLRVLRGESCWIDAAAGAVTGEEVSHDFHDSQCVGTSGGPGKMLVVNPERGDGRKKVHVKVKGNGVAAAMFVGQEGRLEGTQKVSVAGESASFSFGPARQEEPVWMMVWGSDENSGFTIQSWHDFLGYEGAWTHAFLLGAGFGISGPSETVQGRLRNNRSFTIDFGYATGWQFDRYFAVHGAMGFQGGGAQGEEPSAAGHGSLMLGAGLRVGHATKGLWASGYVGPSASMVGAEDMESGFGLGYRFAVGWGEVSPTLYAHGVYLRGHHIVSFGIGLGGYVVHEFLKN